MIVAAAIKLPGRDGHALICHVPRPGRHHNVLHSLRMQFKSGCERTFASYEAEVQGFLTDTGQFLNRRAALIHVHKCGQPMLRKPGVGYQGDELFSEDLW